jgi:hypothetical protein
LRGLGDEWPAALWNIVVLDSRGYYEIDGFRDEDHTAAATFIFSASVSGGWRVEIARVVLNRAERESTPGTAAKFLTPYRSHNSIHVFLSLSLSLSIDRIFPCLVSRFIFHFFIYFTARGIKMTLLNLNELSKHEPIEHLLILIRSINMQLYLFSFLFLFSSIYSLLAY